MDNKVDLKAWQRAATAEAVKISLEAMKDLLPSAQRVRKIGDLSGVEQELTTELREQLSDEIDSALKTLSTLDRNTFDIDDMFKAGHNAIMFNCLEQYGEYLNSLINFVAFAYRATFEERFGMSPEAMVDKIKKENLENLVKSSD